MLKTLFTDNSSITTPFVSSLKTWEAAAPNNRLFGRFHTTYEKLREFIGLMMRAIIIILIVALTLSLLKKKIGSAISLQRRSQLGSLVLCQSLLT